MNDPTSPYSDVSLKDISLKDAMNSRLFKKIRGTPHSWTESSSGCALYSNEEWVRAMVS